MSKKHAIQLSIPKPCTEDWANMTPNEQGRHCESCNKTVVDFSLFTDRQLIELFEKAKGVVCGRIPKYQLQRQLVYTEPQNHFLHKLLFGTAITVGFAGSANAVYNPRQTSLVEQYLGSKEKDPLVGGGKDSIRVKVVDSATGSPLPFALVQVFYNNTLVNGNQTDFDGNIIISGLKQYDFDKLSLTTVYTGYHDYATKQISSDMQISLVELSAAKKEVVIYPLQGAIACSPLPQNQININLIDSKSGKPLSNVSVKLTWNDKEESIASSDSLGTVQLGYERGLNGLKLVIHIAEPGYQVVDKKIKASSEENVSIKLKAIKK